MALAVVVLLSGWYVGAWLTVSRAAVHGIILPSTAESTRPLFRPLIAYCESDILGSDLMAAMWRKMNPPTSIAAGTFIVIGTPPLSPNSHVGVILAPVSHPLRIGPEEPLLCPE